MKFPFETKLVQANRFGWEIGAVACVLLLLFPCAAAWSDENIAYAPETVLKTDYPDANQRPTSRSVGTLRVVEFCGGDWCQEVSSGGDAPTEMAWDALFVMFYYFDANDVFRKRRKLTAEGILGKYLKDCKFDTEEANVSCVLEKLQVAHGLAYRRVQYDIGFKCSSEFRVAPPHFTKHGVCTEKAGRN